MKTLWFHGAGDLRLQDGPEPLAAEGQALLRVASVGLCGSDLHWYIEGKIGSTYLSRPFVLGHEFSAYVESGPYQGQLVAVDPSIHCGKCEYCQAGYPNLCVVTRFAGDGVTDGSLAQWITWPAQCLLPLPACMDRDDAAMLEPLGVAVNALDLCPITPGMTVGVFGCGPIGLLLVQLARAAGATQIIACDPFPHRRAAAEAMGATHVFEPCGGGLSAMWQSTRGRGVDAAFEAAGDNAAVSAAVSTCRPAGTVVVVGIPSEDETRFPASVSRNKQLTIRISHRAAHVYDRALSLISAGKVDLRGLVSRRFPLADYTPAFELGARRAGLKMVIHVDA